MTLASTGSTWSHDRGERHAFCYAACLIRRGLLPRRGSARQVWIDSTLTPDPRLPIAGIRDPGVGRGGALHCWAFVPVGASGAWVFVSPKHGDADSLPTRID